jgi:hypothetical protein
MAELTHERLRELMDYDPETGLLTWRVSRPGRGSIKTGDIAGTPKRNGYWQVGIDGRLHNRARLVWYWTYGRWPYPQVDHINRVKDDDRIVNLREATVSQNAANYRHRSNPHGFRGVSCKRARFYAKIRVPGKRINLGSFATAELAAAAYQEAARKYHGEFAYEEAA